MQYEYIIVPCVGNVVPMETLNELGAEGWELIMVANFVGYLKREKKAITLTEPAKPKKRGRPKKVTK